ncbi:LytTR family DNA-binding domain-containing protein [Proteinivorax hydrogeniformans]|uniref:Stage 0 sporulation protein A homolog n=1 Tax=Proteinivorax hydrogeniformans TaxID=1826727 RepID=A0AAU8HR30_9FIRM
MDKVKVAIVDDELPSREELKYLLSHRRELDIAYEADNFEDALDIINCKKVDLLFLDIQLKDKSGVDLAEIIEQHDVEIIFATAYDKYAVKAFSLNAVDYLLKPFSQPRVEKAVNKALKKILKEENVKKTYPPKLTFWKGEKMHVISPEEIVFITVGEKQVKVFTDKGIFTDHATLKDVQQKLDPKSFIRTHRSYIINLEKISEIIPWFNSTFNLKMKKYSDIEIPVSRSYLQSFKQELGLS